MSDNPQHYNIIVRLESQGELDVLTQSGIISTSVLQYYRIAKRMQELRRRRKYTLAGELVRDVAHEFQVKRSTVYKAMQIFK